MLSISRVQEHQGESGKAQHRRQRGGVVGVGGHQEAVELVVLERPHRDLLGPLDVVVPAFVAQ